MLSDEALAVRVLKRKRLKLAYHLLVPAQCEQRFEPQLVRAEAQLLEPVRVGATGRGEHDVGERGSPPHRERRRRESNDACVVVLERGETGFVVEQEKRSRIELRALELEAVAGSTT
jgi:hypothetical protein